MIFKYFATCSAEKDKVALPSVEILKCCCNIISPFIILTHA